MSKYKHPIINKVIIVFFIFLAIFYSVLYFDGRYYSLPIDFAKLLRFILFTIISFLIASIWIRISVDKFMDLFKELEIEQKLFLSKAYNFVVYLIALSLVMIRLGLSLNNLSLILGFAATGFAFAIREVILSYIVWFMLLTKKPFRIGDFIKIGEEEGKVMHIGTFYVLLDNTPDKKEDYIRVPNKTFLEKPVINFGKNEVLHKIEIPIEKIPKVDLGKLESELSKYHTKINLESDKEKLFLSITFRANYTDRKRIGSEIIKYVFERIKF